MYRKPNLSPEKLPLRGLPCTANCATACSGRTDRLTYRLRPVTGSRPAETRSSHRPSPLLRIDPLPYLLWRATPKGYVIGGTP